MIHTGLSIFISEVAEILGYANGLLSRYAKRILEIAKCLLNQIEMAVSAKIALDTVAENNKVTDTTSDVTFTGNYADFCELIHLIIACKFINGGIRRTSSISRKGFMHFSVLTSTRRNIRTQETA